MHITISNVRDTSWHSVRISQDRRDHARLPTQPMQRVLLQETCAESSARIAFRLDDAGDDVGGIDCDDSDIDDVEDNACMSY